MITLPISNHSLLLNLSADDHTQYALLAGRSGGQSLSGGTAANDDITIQGTTNGTRTTSYAIIQPNGGLVSIGHSTPAQLLDLKSSTADASIRAQTTSDSNYAGLLIYDSAGLLTFSFQYGNVNAAALSSEAFFATRQSATPLNFYQGGVAAANLRISLPGSGSNTVIGGLTSAGASVLGIKAGTSSNDAAVGGVLDVATASTGNVLTGEDTIASYSIPANSLSADGMALRFEAYGTIANNANNKRVRMRFGTTGTNLVLDTGTGAGLASSAYNWVMTGTIVRTGAATQKGFVEFTYGLTTTAGSGIYLQNNLSLNQTLSGAVTLEITGDATASNDVVCECFRVWWDDANT